MRTTIGLDPDVEAAVDRLRRDEGLGLSEAVNTLARRGMVTSRQGDRYTTTSRSMGARIDITNIGEVLDLLDQDDAL